MPAAEEGAEKKERKEDEEPPEEGMVQSRSSSRKSNASIDDSKPIGDESRSAPTAVSNGDDVDQRNDLGIEGISDDDLEMSDGNDDGAMPGGEKSKAKLEKNVLKHASKKNLRRELGIVRRLSAIAWPFQADSIDISHSSLGLSVPEIVSESRSRTEHPDARPETISGMERPRDECDISIESA
jgi:hypothetical protein